jgi:hypothetical protein
MKLMVENGEKTKARREVRDVMKMQMVRNGMQRMDAERAHQ